VECLFHLAARKDTFGAVRVNQLGIDRITGKVRQRHNQVAGLIGGVADTLCGGQRQGGDVSQPLVRQVGVTGIRFSPGNKPGGFLCRPEARLRLFFIGFFSRTCRKRDGQRANQVGHPAGGFLCVHVQRLFDQRQPVARAALVADPRPATGLIVKVEAVFAAADRARRVLSGGVDADTQRGQQLRPVTGGGAHGVGDDMFHAASLVQRGF